MHDAFYRGPIVDAHQHFWDPIANDHPWLAPQASIPFRYGDYSAIKRRYFPDDYRQDAQRHNVVESVYVETEWNPNDPLGETAFIDAVARRHGLANAVVAQAWLNADDAAQVLAGQAAFGRVRSVRHKPGGPDRPEAVGSARSLMSDERWRRGYAELAGHGLHFDLQAPWWNLPEAECLARDFPATQIILNHAGLPSDRSAHGLQAWHQAMARLAEHPNVAVKISGLGQAGRPWTVADNGWIVRQCIDLFGPERAMFASNFPVDSLCARFDDIYDGFKQIVVDLPASAQRQLFCDTARRIYRTQQDVTPTVGARTDQRTFA